MAKTAQASIQTTEVLDLDLQFPRALVNTKKVGGNFTPGLNPNRTANYGVSITDWINYNVGTSSSRLSNVVSVDGTQTISGAKTLSNASLTLSGIPTYADDAAADAGGLTEGEVYQTATGELRIKTA